MRWNVLLLGCDRDSDCLDQRIGPYTNLTRVGSPRSAFTEVERGSYDVVLCPWDLRGASWRTVLEHVRSRQPERPLIVFCHCGGEQEWIEVLGAGAFDLLCPPYNEDQVMALIEHAAASRYARSVVNAGAN